MARPATGQVVEKVSARGRVFALRFRAYGKRQYLTLGTDAEGWDRQRAELELQNVLADVRRGIWRPVEPETVPSPPVDVTFHEFASEWLEAVAPGLAEGTVARYRWQLTHHLLPFFAGHRLSQITVAEVDRYRDAKVRERRGRDAQIRAAQTPEQLREARALPGLSAGEINKTLVRLGQILDVADERELIDRNPLRVNPRRRKLKASKPASVWLDRADQITALLRAARDLDAEARADRRHVPRHAIMATFVFGGLRIEELCALRWRDVDLAAGRLRVADSKTDAGRRYVELLAPAREALTTHKADAGWTSGAAFVFATRDGGQPSKNNVRARVFNAAVKRANANLERDGLVPLPDGLTPHKLRHTFASLLFALGEDPVHVMGQLGHTDPAFSLRVYAHAMRREGADKKALKALVAAADWAPMGTGDENRAPETLDAPAPEKQKTPQERGFRRARPARFELATSASGGQRSIH
jgi:integrase